MHAYADLLRRTNRAAPMLSEQDRAFLVKASPMLTWFLHDSGRLDDTSTNAKNDEWMSHIARLYDLESLSLGSDVTDAGLVHLKGLVNLKELFSSSRLVSDAGLSHLRGLTNLKVLSLSGSRITGSGLSELTGLTNLETLNLACAPVKDDELARLSSLPHLRELNLADTPITDAGLIHIRSLKNLESVDLQYSHVTLTGARRLQQERPDLVVRYHLSGGSTD
jgi:Leucine-rich repeat (LRR) protein